MEYAAKSEATAIEEADEGPEGTDGGVAARAGVEGLHEVLSLFYRVVGLRGRGTAAVPPPPPPASRSKSTRLRFRVGSISCWSSSQTGLDAVPVSD